LNNKPYSVVLGSDSAEVNGKKYSFDIKEGAATSAAPAASAAAAVSGGSVKINAPLPGLVVKIDVEVGQKISAGDVLIVLEAMKMEIEVKAPSAGTVSKIAVTKGSQVDAGHFLVEIS